MGIKAPSYRDVIEDAIERFQEEPETPEGEGSEEQENE